MTEPLSVSKASDVQPPVLEQVLELRRLTTKDGKPVRVLCERIDEEVVFSILQTLPQEVPSSLASVGDAKRDRAREILRRYGPPIIEAGTALVGDDGQMIRPAFWFTEPKPGAIDGRYLSAGDRQRLFTVLMQLSGYAGGPATPYGFPADGGGRTDGGGAVGADEGDAEVGAGSPA